MSVIKETLDAKIQEDESGHRILNQYILKKQLGSGSFGVVYLGEDTQEKRKVAIKECSKSKLKKQKQAASGMIGGRGRGRGRGTMRRVTVSRPHNAENAASPIDLVRGEVAILKRLDHPNVVKLFEVLDDPSQDSLFMVFELCEKGTVLDITMDADAKPLPIDTARNYFQQLILGIEYLHEHEIAHRDIKPDNMLISADGVLKIVDFGVSEMFTKGSDKMKNTAGSPAFYPPENVGLTKGDLSGIPADIWAMGITLYAFIFGRLPFTGKTIILLYEHIRESAVEYPAGTDPRLIHTLSRLLEKDPLKRIELEELRVDPWVTDDGKKALIPFELNCAEEHLVITESDVKSAFGRGTTILKAASKFKALGAKRASMSQQGSTNNNPAPPPTHQEPIVESPSK